MSLQGEIDKWAKSAEGKKKIEAERKRAMAAGREFGQSGGHSNRSPSYYADRLTTILDAEIKAAGFEFGDYLYQVDAGYNEAEKRYELHVNFKPEEIDRPSLIPEKYPDGAYDIVVLMNKGYRAGGAVYGVDRHGVERWSLREREGAHFIQDAVEKFNNQYWSVAQADYSNKY